MVTHTGTGVYLGVSHASHPKIAEFQRSPILGVLVYLCLDPLTQNEEIRHGNIWGGTCFKRSATPLCLHKGVARFVSDS